LKYYCLKEVYETGKSQLTKKIIATLKLDINNKNLAYSYLRVTKEVIIKVINSKLKDHRRGRKIIDDYEEWHADIEDDQLISKLKDDLGNIKKF
jgi:hypothetical protein